MPSSAVTVVEKSTVVPEESSAMKPLKLSVSDLPMLSCQYIQKGVLLPAPPRPAAEDFVEAVRLSLAAALSHFPPLSGRLSTDAAGHVSIVCSDAGVDFVHARASHLSLAALLGGGGDGDLPECFREFFAYDHRTLSYSGHSRPLVAVQVTELGDGGVFIGVTANHAVADGTSFWHFFNTLAEICCGPKRRFISKSPDFGRCTVFDSPAVLRFPPGGPEATFAADEPLRERIFHFSRDAIAELKLRANADSSSSGNNNNAEIAGKTANDRRIIEGEISSFQSLCAQLWRSVTRARSIEAAKTTTFRMAVNCRHRVSPPMEAMYFGNAIQSIPTACAAGELLSRGLGFGAGLLRRNVAAHGDATVRKGVAAWEAEPRLFPLGNFDGASITMGSSPRFPMFDNDFGWGKPLAVRSGRANKFDGKISAFPARDGDGSIDLEVVLAPETMAGLLTDQEFMQYVSNTKFDT